MPVFEGRRQGGLRGLRRWAGSDPRGGSAPKVTHHVRQARPHGGRRWCVTAHLAAGILERRKFLELLGMPTLAVLRAPA